MNVRRGDILIADMREIPGTSIQNGVRPVVVISNNKANAYSPVLTVVPFTSKLNKKRYLPTHVYVGRHEMIGLDRPGLVLAEQVTSVAVQNIIQKSGSVNDDALNRITKAVEIQIGIFDEDC